MSPAMRAAVAALAVGIAIIVIFPALAEPETGIGWAWIVPVGYFLALIGAAATGFLWFRRRRK